MNKTLKICLNAVAAVMVIAGGARAGEILNGAGATFPFPIYSKWFDVYAQKTGVRINYQSIGSGGGIRQITKNTVDFGATDGPMSKKELYKVDGKLLHIPTVLGAVVPSFNLKETDGKKIESLNLTGPVLADIFLGNIRQWDDERIKAINAGVKLPGAPIVVVRRADGSGTTYAFVDYLSRVSPEWKKRVGVNTSVQWPIGLGAKGNEGVSGLIMQTPNSFGYVEAIYAKQNNLAMAAMKNKAGEYVVASVESIQAAAAGAARSMPPDFRVSISDAEGKGAYPISTYTWMLVREKNRGGKGALLKKFLDWMLEEGQEIAPELGYAPLPDQVKKMVSEAITKIK